MARTKNNAEFPIEVDGEPYLWRLHRLPGWSSDAAALHGMALAVRHEQGKREAVLEFPAGAPLRYGAPQLKPAQIAPELVARAIASAIQAGWQPLSRGKTTTIVVDATGA